MCRDADAEEGKQDAFVEESMETRSASLRELRQRCACTALRHGPHRLLRHTQSLACLPTASVSLMVPKRHIEHDPGEKIVEVECATGEFMPAAGDAGSRATQARRDLGRRPNGACFVEAGLGNRSFHQPGDHFAARESVTDLSAPDSGFRT